MLFSFALFARQHRACVHPLSRGSSTRGEGKRDPCGENRVLTRERVRLFQVVPSSASHAALSGTDPVREVRASTGRSTPGTTGLGWQGEASNEQEAQDLGALRSDQQLRGGEDVRAHDGSAACDRSAASETLSPLPMLQATSNRGGEVAIELMSAGSEEEERSMPRSPCTTVAHGARQGEDGGEREGEAEEEAEKGGGKPQQDEHVDAPALVHDLENLAQDFPGCAKYLMNELDARRSCPAPPKVVKVYARNGESCFLHQPSPR